MSGPCLSLLTVAPEGDLGQLGASIDGQPTGDWEWVVGTLGGNPAGAPREQLRTVGLEAGADGSSLQALLEAASGDFVVFLDPGDALEPNALTHLCKALRRPAEQPVDVLYTDELGDDDELRKPDWSPERLRHVDYVGGLCAVRRELALDVGGLRPGYPGAEVHDLLLRLAEGEPRVVHQHRALVRRASRDGRAEAAWDGAVRAVGDHLRRLGIEAVVRRGTAPGLVHVERPPALDVAASVVIPTIGSSAVVGGAERVMVVETVRSVIAHSTQRELEFVVVYDTPTPPEVLAALRALDGSRPGVVVRLVEFPEPFNFSAKCNVGALHATHDVLVFLNDDMEAVSDEVVGRLVAPLAEPGVGVTGAKLLFENGSIQGAGIQYGSGTIYPSFYKEPGDALGPQGDLWVNRETTALTGACLAVTRTTFEQVGGFNEALPMNFNDVDFCLKVRHVGHRAVWLHDVVLHHFESITRSPQVRPWEFEAIRARWGDQGVVRERYTTGVR